MKSKQKKNHYSLWKVIISSFALLNIQDHFLEMEGVFVNRQHP